MKKFQLYPVIGIIVMLMTSPQIKGQQSSFSPEKAKEALNFVKEQYTLMMQQLPYGKFPISTRNDGTVNFANSGTWMSGFYAGSCWYLYEYSGDKKFEIEATQRTMMLEQEQYNRYQDGWIMLNCSFGNGYRLTGNKNFREILIQSAELQTTFYDPRVGCIRTWKPNRRWSFPVIIDNMLNLELLYWASQVTNDEKFRQIAIQHADKTMENHFRKDFSSYHVVSYHPWTGTVEKKETRQGYSDESAWARGQSWGLYGYVVSYRMTGMEKYLNHAKNIADFLIHHPRLPEDKVPYWDYDAPDIPDAKRDASAAAIMCSALLDLCLYINGDLQNKYLNHAKAILNTLSSSKYTAEKGENGNFILKHCVGSFPDNSGVDVAYGYADYYYIEALMRYLHLPKQIRQLSE